MYGDKEAITSSQTQMAGQVGVETAGRLLKSRSKAEGLRDAIERLDQVIDNLQALMISLTGAEDRENRPEDPSLNIINLQEIINHGPDEIDKKASQLNGLINELREILI